MNNKQFGLFKLNVSTAHGFEPNVSVQLIPGEDALSFTKLKSLPLPTDMDCSLVLSERFEKMPQCEYYERLVRFIEPKEGRLVQQAQRFTQFDHLWMVTTYTHLDTHFEKGWKTYEKMWAKAAEGATDA